MAPSSQIAGYVYLVTNLVNGKKYVGCTKGPVECRWEQHLKDSKSGKPMAIHNAIRKYGAFNFSLEVLEVVEGAHDDLMAAEVRQIAARGCIAPNGYNLTPGGEGVDFTVPLFRERHREGVQRRNGNPVWQNNTRKAGQKRAGDPGWREANLQGARKRWADWRPGPTALMTPRTVASKRRSATPDYREKNLATLPKAWAAHSAKAAERDAHLPPEEQARRARRRELGRVNAKRRYDARKAEGTA
jgi:GIY-YIG catalytic domain